MPRSTALGGPPTDARGMGHSIGGGGDIGTEHTVQLDGNQGLAVLPDLDHQGRPTDPGDYNVELSEVTLYS